jgi:hypothetical protein
MRFLLRPSSQLGALATAAARAAAVRPEEENDLVPVPLVLQECSGDPGEMAHPDRVIALPDAASHPVLGFRRTGEFTRLG